MGDEKMNEWMIFAERITAEMERQQLSIRQLADKIGMTPTTVSRYAKGQRVPRANEILRTADALGVTCDYLLGLSDNPHRINDQGNMISRQAAIDECNKRGVEHIGYAIAHLPSAQPTHTNAPNTLKSLDCIDRQAAIDAASYECNELRRIFGRIEKRLKALPAAQPEQQWIPVSERLPEKYGWYLCTLKDGRVNCYYWSKNEWVDNGKKHFFDLYNICSRYTGEEINPEQEGSVYWTDWVIAWMPLPEPYRREGD